MARYRGGRLKVIRRLGMPLPGLTAKVPRREAGPGLRDARRRKVSDYGRQLTEKQKLRYHYGVLETQLRRYYQDAARRRGVTGEIMLSLLERRLDNVVFRLGLAPTMPAARQLVSHGHVVVDGRRVTVPGYQLRPGQSVAIGPASRGIPLIRESAGGRGLVRPPSYLERSEEDPLAGRVVGDPIRQDVPFEVDEAAVIAYYSRRGG